MPSRVLTFLYLLRHHQTREARRQERRLQPERAVFDPSNRIPALSVSAPDRLSAPFVLRQIFAGQAKFARLRTGRPSAKTARPSASRPLHPYSNSSLHAFEQRKG